MGIKYKSVMKRPQCWLFSPPSPLHYYTITIKITGNKPILQFQLPLIFLFTITITIIITITIAITITLYLFIIFSLFSIKFDIKSIYKLFTHFIKLFKLVQYLETVPRVARIFSIMIGVQGNVCTLIKVRV